MPPKKKTKPDPPAAADTHVPAGAPPPTVTAPPDAAAAAARIAELEREVLQAKIDRLEAEKQAVLAQPPAPQLIAPAPAPAAAGGPSDAMLVALLQSQAQQQAQAQQQQQFFMTHMLASQGSNTSSKARVPTIVEPQFNQANTDARHIFRSTNNHASMEPFMKAAADSLLAATDNAEFGKLQASLQSVQDAEKGAALMKQAEDFHKANYGKVTSAVLSMLDTAADACVRMSGNSGSRRPESSRSRNTLPKGGYCYVCGSTEHWKGSSACKWYKYEGTVPSADGPVTNPKGPRD